MTTRDVLELLGRQLYTLSLGKLQHFLGSLQVTSGLTLLFGQQAQQIIGLLDIVGHLLLPSVNFR